MREKHMREKHQSNVAKNTSFWEPPLDDREIHELVARRAYELYEKRGCQGGHECEDWFEAERLIRAEVESRRVILSRAARERVA